MRIYPSLCGVLVSLLCVVSAVTRAQAQDVNFELAPHWAVGYVVAAPVQFVGFSGLTFGPQMRDWGVYVDAKFTFGSPEGESNFDPSLTPEDAEGFGDIVADDKSVWTTVSVAVMRVVSAEAALYAGAGYAHEDAYVQYFDELRERGELGFYWVKDEKESGDRINLMVGAFVRATPRVLLQFGGQTAPVGAMVGVAIVLPFGR
ncbi:MAG: hypothetical protein GTN75_00700 [Gemmatimonadetes bacterium]|nr:hypothetical protein [Gemmatimonadota bacterium]